jgi:hypothetical protein
MKLCRYNHYSEIDGKLDPQYPELQAHIFAETVPVNYTDVTSISNLDKYGRSTGYDYLYINEELIILRDQQGYNNLSDDDKKILLKRFCAGPGNDYIDPLYTQQEHDNFYAKHRANLEKVAESRDTSVVQYLMMNVHQGTLTQLGVEKAVNKSSQLRDDLRRDIKMGKPFGDQTEGIEDFVENINSYAGNAIVAIDTNTNTISVAGNLVPDIEIGQNIGIYQSTGNDGDWVASNVIYNSPNTDITVTGDITDNTVDGLMYHVGLLSCEGCDINIQNEIKDKYKGKK